jgi:predicted DNA binding CopG/RHH family protein
MKPKGVRKDIAKRRGSKTGSASVPTSIRLSEEVIELARKQAARRGLPYQTYIKSLLHETLIGREAGSVQERSRTTAV